MPNPTHEFSTLLRRAMQGELAEVSPSPPELGTPPEPEPAAGSDDALRSAIAATLGTSGTAPAPEPRSNEATAFNEWWHSHRQNQHTKEN